MGKGKSVPAIARTPSVKEVNDLSTSKSVRTPESEMSLKALKAVKEEATKEARSSAKAHGGVASMEELALAGAVGVVAVSIIFGLIPSHWLAIVACLLGTAVFVLGIDAVKRIPQDFKPAPEGIWMRVPLTDATIGQSTLNKIANSCQCREKGLKILQYVLKTGAYVDSILPKAARKQCKDLSKATSIARRFFKFFRWIKHFEDLEEAKEEKGLTMRSLLYLRIAANFGADWAEDVCSLERIGMLPKGTLSVEFMLFAEYCQLVLAFVEVFVTSVRARKEAEATHDAEASGLDHAKLVKQQRKLCLVRLELTKFVSDIGKAIFDCELHFAHEGVFIGCSFFSAIISTHKNMVKVLK